MKKKITVIGHYAKGKQLFDGQTVKTRILYDEFEASGLYDIDLIDTCGWKRNLFSLISKCYRACRNSDYILMLPDFNGFRAMSILLPFFRGRNGAKLIYVVVGGWLPGFLEKKKLFLNRVNLFDAIVVETNSLKKEMESIGAKNLYIVPNFKRLEILSDASAVETPPYRFCTFSRVMKEKGIEDAIESVITINKKRGSNVAVLDIYGQIDAGYKETFEQLIKTFPDYVQYKGTVPFDKSVHTLKEYYALLFPTRYLTEGVPGTIIDAFASGLPVISYTWNSVDDLISDNVEGWLTTPAVENLIALMEKAIDSPADMTRMRQNCLKKANTYTPDTNLRVIGDILEQL